MTKLSGWLPHSKHGGFGLGEKTQLAVIELMNYLFFIIHDWF